MRPLNQYYEFPRLVAILFWIIGNVNKILDQGRIKILMSEDIHLFEIVDIAMAVIRH